MNDVSITTSKIINRFKDIAAVNLESLKENHDEASNT